MSLHKNTGGKRRRTGGQPTTKPTSHGGEPTTKPTSHGGSGAADYAMSVYGPPGQQVAVGGNDHTIKMNSGVVGQCGGAQELSPSTYQGGKKLSLRNLFKMSSLGMKKKRSYKKRKTAKKAAKKAPKKTRRRR